MPNFTGGPGPDFFIVDETDEIIRGNGGDEFLNGADGSDQVNGGDDNDELQGGAGDDALIGGAGNDTLSGDFGFFGPAGADTLTGGAGADLYGWQIGNAASTSLAQDRVTDFEGAGAAGGDTLELELPFDINRRLVFEGRLAAMPAIGATLPFGGNGFTEVF